MAKNASYFITGGYGLIGSAVANSLTGNITILSHSKHNKERLTRSDTKIILKDLTGIEKKDIEGVDVIYHLASTVDNYNVLSDPYIDVNTNLNGTIHLLEMCKNLQKKPKIIYPSTFFVYGNEYDRTHTPITENSQTDPLAIYPATKLCAESIIKLYSKLYDIPYVICRLTNVYGAQENYDNKKKGGLNYLIMQAIRGKNLHVYRGGNFRRDYIYVDDVVSALTILEEKAENDIFLVGNGTAVLFKDIINYICIITNTTSKIIEIDPPRFHEIVGIRNFVADTSKISKLGFKSAIDYKEGIQRVVQRYKTLL